MRTMWTFVVSATVIAVLPSPAAGQVTFTRDIAPILQRSCQKCHRPDSVAPMSLLTYENVRPYARTMKFRTALRDKPGVMPPWFIEKNIGIQHFKNDPSLSEDEIAMIAEWADSGAPRGDPADMPPPLEWADANIWEIGEPDLIVSSPPFEIAALAPDWFGNIGSSPMGLTEDRYIAAYQIKEVNDSREQPSLVDTAAKTTAGSFIVHHATVNTVGPDESPTVGPDESPTVGPDESPTVGPDESPTVGPDESPTVGPDESPTVGPDESPTVGPDESPTVGPDESPNFGGCCNVHEVGRNAEFFDPDAGKLVEAGSQLVFTNSHIHAIGKDTKGRLDVGFKFHPRGYEPTVQSRNLFIGTSPELIDIPGMDSDVRHEAIYTLQENMKLTVFEPHMHAPGVRMCVEAIYGEEVQTLNCAGYEHSWVLAYTYADDAQPLLPKGTILRTVGYMNNSPSNRNVPDPRNWLGAGHRSIDMMNIALWQAISLTDEQFEEALLERRQKLQVSEGGTVIGCPLCGPDQGLPAQTGANQPPPVGGQ